MPWSRKLILPLVLKDGHAIVDLGDARRVILSLPERRQVGDHWQYASDLLMRAAKGDATEIDVARVASQLKVALTAEGML